MDDIPRISDREITPPSLYFNRRRFLQAATVSGSVIATASLYRALNPIGHSNASPAVPIPVAPTAAAADDPQAESWKIDDPLTAESSIINYNNFYEFTTYKEGVAAAAAGFKTDDWRIEIDGLVNKPKTITIDDLHAISPPQERVYRMRCVEAWSMVIPWVGVPLAHLLNEVEPTADATHVAFETLLDPSRMPGQKTRVLQWPYVEGLRLDEAMHPLTILATGLYGKSLPPQDGAPVRLVVPWKYGFKGIKSIVRISLVAEEPVTSWGRFAPFEYGFYANVNPEVDHPRWSQATEQRIGERGRRRTLMFNGYEPQVAGLYSNMDLTRYF